MRLTRAPSRAQHLARPAPRPRSWCGRRGRALLFTRHARVWSVVGVRWSGSGGWRRDAIHHNAQCCSIPYIQTAHTVPPSLVCQKEGDRGNPAHAEPLNTQETGVLEGSPQRVRATVYPPNPGAAVSHGKARIVVVTSSQLTRETPCGLWIVCRFPLCFPAPLVFQ